MGPHSAKEIERVMTGRKTVGFPLALLLLLWLLPVPLASGEGFEDSASNPHAHFRNPGTCRRCHASPEPGKDPDQFLPEADEFCLECHTTEGLGVSHPRNVRPGDKPHSMTVPKDLRLDGQGRILCLTCHNAHGPFRSPTRAFDAQEAANPEAPRDAIPSYRTYFVRRSDPVRGFVVLCEECHGKR